MSFTKAEASGRGRDVGNEVMISIFGMPNLNGL
jgi:hypothetical protein